MKERLKVFPYRVLMFFRILYTLFFFTIILSCNNISDITVPINDISNLSSVNSENIVVKKWQILGPIYRDTTNNKATIVLNSDENSLFEYWKVNENDLTSSNFLSFSKNNVIKKKHK